MTTQFPYERQRAREALLEQLYQHDLILEMAKIRHKLAVEKRKFGNRAALAQNVKTAETNRLSTLNALKELDNGQ